MASEVESALKAHGHEDCRGVITRLLFTSEMWLRVASAGVLLLNVAGDGFPSRVGELVGLAMLP